MNFQAEAESFFSTRNIKMCKENFVRDLASLLETIYLKGANAGAEEKSNEIWNAAKKIAGVGE